MQFISNRVPCCIVFGVPPFSVAPMLSQPAGNHCIAILALTLFVSACSSQAPKSSPSVTRQAAVTPVPATRPLQTGRSVGEYAAVSAVRQVGVPYLYGGRSTRGFDCSGLVSFAYASAGKSMPRTTNGLWRELRPVSVNELRIGDVLFFNIEGKMSHVGLYLGDRRFVHAPSSGKTVTVSSIDADYYRRALIRGGRPRWKTVE